MGRERQSTSWFSDGDEVLLSLGGMVFNKSVCWCSQLGRKTSFGLVKFDSVWSVYSLCSSMRNCWGELAEPCRIILFQFSGKTFKNDLCPPYTCTMYIAGYIYQSPSLSLLIHVYNQRSLQVVVLSQMTMYSSRDGGNYASSTLAQVTFANDILFYDLVCLS